MGKEQIFTEHRAVFGGNHRRNRDARKRLKLFQKRFMQRERHQTRARWQYLQTKLLGNFIAKRRGAQPGMERPPLAITRLSALTVSPFSCSV
jgi:hypothetical protein